MYALQAHTHGYDIIHVHNNTQHIIHTALYVIVSVQDIVHILIIPFLHYKTMLFIIQSSLFIKD